MKKKLDSRISTLITNGLKLSHRSFFVLVGDRGRDQIATLHYILSKSTVKSQSVLWCYKKELGFSANANKRVKKLKADVKKGMWRKDEGNEM